MDEIIPTGDRQMAKELKNIDEGHKARYHFACSKVSGFVLDAACGVGYGSQMMMKHADVTGIDIEPEAIAHAEKYYPGPDYRIGNVCEVHGQFDWIVSFETIEHVVDPIGTLKTFRDEADRMIISSPNELHYPFKPEKYSMAKYPHIRHYTPTEFEALIKSAGWTVREKWGQVKKRSDVSRESGVFMVWICE